MPAARSQRGGSRGSHESRKSSEKAPPSSSSTSSSSSRKNQQREDEGYTEESSSSAGGPVADPSLYYDVLGVSSDAEGPDITRAYRKLALKHHPDKQPATASPQQVREAQELFARISEAYSVLSDADKRRAYDSSGAQGVENAANMEAELHVMHGFACSLVGHKGPKPIIPPNLRLGLWHFLPLRFSSTRQCDVVFRGTLSEKLDSFHFWSAYAMNVAPYLFGVWLISLVLDSTLFSWMLSWTGNPAVTMMLATVVLTTGNVFMLAKSARGEDVKGVSVLIGIFLLGIVLIRFLVPTRLCLITMHLLLYFLMAGFSSELMLIAMMPGYLFQIGLTLIADFYFRDNSIEASSGFWMSWLLATTIMALGAVWVVFFTMLDFKSTLRQAGLEFKWLRGIFRFLEAVVLIVFGLFFLLFTIAGPPILRVFAKVFSLLPERALRELVNCGISTTFFVVVWFLDSWVGFHIEHYPLIVVGLLSNSPKFSVGSLVLSLVLARYILPVWLAQVISSFSICFTVLALLIPVTELSVRRLFANYKVRLVWLLWICYCDLGWRGFGYFTSWMPLPGDLPDPNFLNMPTVGLVSALYAWVALLAANWPAARAVIAKVNPAIETMFAELEKDGKTASTTSAEDEYGYSDDEN